MPAAHCGWGATKKEGQKLLSDCRKLFQLKYTEREMTAKTNKKELVMFFLHEINSFKEITNNSRAVCWQCHLLFSCLKEHGDLSFDVGLPQDKFDIRSVFGSLTQHALDQLSQLGIIPAGHLWQLMRNPEKNVRTHCETHLPYILYLDYQASEK